MKQILSLILAMAMVAALFTGCGCAANVSTEPNGMITEEATTRPTVMPTPTATHETTRPMESTLPTVTGSDPTGSTGSMGGDVGGSGGTNGGNGSNENSVPTGIAESTTPTDGTMAPKHRTRDTAR